MAKPIVGVDLGGTNIRFGLVSSKGEVLERSQCRTEGHEGAARTLERILDGIAGMLDKARAGVVGIGVGSPGPLDSSGTILHSPNIPGWGKIRLKDAVLKRFGLPCKVANDANCAALAEHWVGVGRGTCNLVHYTLGTGIGGGVIVEGRLLEGRDCAGAELGHVTIVPDGLLCGCGSQGCLETYASATGIVRRTLCRLLQGGPSVLARMKPETVTARVIHQAAKHGDRLALEIIEDTGRLLGIAIGAAINIFNPEVVSFSGGVANFGALLFKPMRAEVERRAFRAMVRGVRFPRSRLSDNAGMIGAARALLIDLGRDPV
ncbi:MAG: ROK family protein [Verrucomicrobia bacterium]|nr:ROK family protein [Verrucomicrobiota bacterium]